MEQIKFNEIDEKLSASEYVLLDFSSPGCGPCKKMPQFITELLEEEEIKDKDIKAWEINIAETPEAAQKFMVMGVPTLIIFKDGKEIDRHMGSVPKKAKIVKKIVK